MDLVLHDFTGIGLYFGFIVVFGVPALLLKFLLGGPFELTRKVYHLLITLSILPLVTFFNYWWMAVLAVFLFALVTYPLLALLERTGLYRRIAVERHGGEFKHSLLVFQASLALMIFIFWGLLGVEWRFVAVVAVMAWGFGDAAAALVGKRFGRHQIFHPLIEGPKTLEGTHAMYFTAGLAIFLSLLIYAGLPWYTSLVAALLVAPVCALVELFSNRGLDTITVPISTGLALLTLLSLMPYFTPTGV